MIYLDMNQLIKPVKVELIIDQILLKDSFIILLIKANIGKRGNSGCFQYHVSVSAFSTADRNALRKPRLPILAKR